MNDSWGLSEQGLALSCTALIPACSQVPSLEHFRPYEALRVIPGCAGKPMPGMNIHVVDDHGREAPPNTMGNLVMGLPLSPSSFRTLWAEDERFYTSYLKRFDGKWFDTSDAGMIDDNGYVTVMSRSDDVINVAGHRLSTGKLCSTRTLHRDTDMAQVLSSKPSLRILWSRNAALLEFLMNSKAICHSLSSRPSAP